MAYFGDKEIENLKKDLESETDTKEFKQALYKLVDVIEDLGKAYDEIEGQIEEIDEDLADLEEYVYMGEKKETKLEFEPDEDLGFDLKCPACNELVTIKLADSKNDKIICPNCKAELNFDDGGCSGGCDGCGCGCGDK